MLTRDPWVRALVIVLLSISGLYLAGLIWQIASGFSDIILLFFLAWVVAFVLEPVVDALQRQALLPRPVAVSIAYVGMLVLGAAAAIWAVPALSRQTVQLARELPAYVAFLAEHFVSFQETLEGHGLNVNLAALVQLEDLVRRAEALGPPVLANAVTLATQIASFVIQLVLVLMLSFYVMLDGHRIKRGVLVMMPDSFRQDVEFFVASVNRAFAGFLRGQLIQALLYSIGTAGIMWAVGLDLILLTAVVNTILMLVPFVGPPLALVLPLSIAAFEEPTSFWSVLVVVTALQLVIVNVVAPRVMSSAVGVHPLLVFVGLLAGAKVAGVWGALFGVPVVAVIAAMATFYHTMIEEKRAHAVEAAADPSVAPPIVAAVPDATRPRSGDDAPAAPPAAVRPTPHLRIQP